MRIGRLEEFNHRFTSPLDLAAHAAAHVKDHPQGHGGVLTGKMTDLLSVLPLVNCEILLVKSGDQAVHGIGNGYGNEDQIYIRLEGFGMGLESRIDLIHRL